MVLILYNFHVDFLHWEHDYMLKREVNVHTERGVESFGEKNLTRFPT